MSPKKWIPLTYNVFDHEGFINIFFVFRFQVGAAVRCSGGRTLQVLNFLLLIFKWITFVKLRIRISIRVRK